MNRATLLGLALGIVGISTIAQADTNYFNGFENAGDESAWIADGAPAVRAATNSDPYSVGSAGGNYHATVTNDDDDYQPGYGTGGYTYFGGKVATYPGPFSQSMAIYINADWAAPTNASTDAFWLDMSPSNTSGTSDYDAEHDFAFFANGSSVSVEADNGNGPTLADITTSGWYTFQMSYQKGATGSSPIETTLSVLGPGNTVLGSTTLDGGASSALGGNGYAWLTVWQNGFAGDHLDIDNLQTSSTPLPASAWGGLMLLGGLGVVRLLKHRREVSA